MMLKGPEYPDAFIDIFICCSNHYADNCKTLQWKNEMCVNNIMHVVDEQLFVQHFW